MKLSDTSLALFFTTKGRSLANWDRLGMLERELTLYRAAANYFKIIYFFTYGADDARYQALLPENVKIIPKPRFIPVFAYSVLMPFFHAGIVRRVDILKTNQMDGSWTAVIAKRLFGARLVVRCGYEWLQFIERAKRGWVKRFVASVVERIAYRAADTIIHTSHAAISFAQQRFSIPDERIRYIPNFIDTELFSPTTVSDGAKIVFVGRLEAQKNIPALIDALAGLPYTLTIVGEGSQRAALAAQAAERNVSIEWQGTVSQRDLPALLRQHALFVLPSLYEGSPKTLLEAMACGLPCIATDVLGSREVIEQGVTGVICSPDTAALREAIIATMSNPAKRASMGAAARRTILETYSFEKVFEQELSVYTAL